MWQALLKKPKPLVMGILNVTPDSFSDGLPNAKATDFLARAEMLLQDGADILDVGAESTRPGASLLSVDEEIRRLRPFLEAFRVRHPNFALSLDTRKTAVAKTLAEFDFSLINDTSCLADPRLAEVAAKANAGYVLMHSRGTPETMTALTAYEGDIPKAVFCELENRVAVLKSLNFPFQNLVIDPGFGFAKTMEQCRSMMDKIGLWMEFSHSLDPINPPVLLFAVSRKRFLQFYVGEKSPIERDQISAVLAKEACQTGFQIIRTHNVSLTKQIFCG